MPGAWIRHYLIVEKRFACRSRTSSRRFGAPSACTARTESCRGPQFARRISFAAGASFETVRASDSLSEGELPRCARRQAVLRSMDAATWETFTAHDAAKDLRCKVEVIFQSTLADTNGLLERESGLVCEFSLFNAVQRA